MDTKIFQKLSYGLYVVSSVKDGTFNGQIANTVFQISSEPCTVGISINKNNLTHEFICSSKVFSVSVLPQNTTLDIIGHFGFKSGRNFAKYQSISFKQGETGAPVLLEGVIGYLEAQVVNAVDVGTHTLFIGKVINTEVFNEETPLTYDYYQQIKRGLAGKKPVQQQERDTVNQGNHQPKYQCTVCGYIYDPAQGDPDAGIAPGTAFEDIPDDWACPICGVTKANFEVVQ